MSITQSRSDKDLTISHIAIPTHNNLTEHSQNITRFNGTVNSSNSIRNSNPFNETHAHNTEQIYTPSQNSSTNNGSKGLIDHMELSPPIQPTLNQDEHNNTSGDLLTGE
jgi:hypothetical protein